MANIKSNIPDFIFILGLTCIKYYKYIFLVKGKIHIFIDQNEKPSILEDDQENIISSNKAHKDICMKLVEILEIENNTLYKNTDQMSKKSTVKDDENWKP